MSEKNGSINGTTPPVVEALPKFSKAQLNAMMLIGDDKGVFNEPDCPRESTYKSLAALGLVKKVTLYEYTEKGWEWHQARRKAWYKAMEERDAKAPPRNEIEAHIRKMNDSEREQLKTLIDILECKFPGMDEYPIGCTNPEMGKLTMRENLLTAWMRAVPPATAVKLADAIRVRESEKQQ